MRAAHASGERRRSAPILIVRIAVFLIGAFLSVKESSATLGWYFVGTIFGVVVLVWHERSVREAVNLRNVVFLVVSTLIWILVLQLILGSLANEDLTGTGELLHDVFFYGPVALGTALLAIAHARLLGASKGRVLMAIPIVFGIWYLSQAYESPLQQVHIPVWQGAYLLCMFSPKPRFLRPQRRNADYSRS